MHRFYCPRANINAGHALLDGPEAVHALRVLRLRAGQVIALVDETGREYQGVIESRRGPHGIVRITSLHEPRPDAVRLALAAAVPKAGAFDDIVDQATQLGAGIIIPMITERTVTRLSPERWQAKHRRWQRKAREAVKQCGRTSLPAVLPVHSFAAALCLAPRYEVCLMGSLQPDAVALKRVLHGRAPASAMVLIGPEGDFSPQEYRRAKDAGFTAISLGSRVLRCETAVIALLGIIAYEWAL